MTEIYSHSKLSLFEMCPEAYYVKYIDKTFPELPQSIHAFLGSTTHLALEHLYSELMNGKKLSLDEVIEYFLKSWHENFRADIRIPFAENIQNFLNKGIKFLIDYYKKNYPFSENTIELEKKIYFSIAEGIYITGYIDRIEKHSDSSYEVHDYKTNEKIKSQYEVDLDRQLGFYNLGIKSLFGEKVKVKLTWHFLAHNKKIHSYRSEEQLDKLKSETLKLIEKIKSTKKWVACEKPWCDWCSYKKRVDVAGIVTNEKNISSLDRSLKSGV